MAKSISRVVQNLIDSDLSLQHALGRSYANYSAIARMLKPVVEETLEREVEKRVNLKWNKHLRE